MCWMGGLALKKGLSEWEIQWMKVPNILVLWQWDLHPRQTREEVFEWVLVEMWNKADEMAKYSCFGEMKFKPKENTRRCIWRGMGWLERMLNIW
jgi:hypothetical protein